MPVAFESLGIRFLYPDNWTIAQRDDDEGLDGVTLDLPSGGFLSIERVHRVGRFDERTADQIQSSEDELIEAVANGIAEEYGEVEREEVATDLFGDQTRQIDFRFYYLDLVILSRLILATINTTRFVIQIQAESRDFNENEMVFAAVIKQLQDSSGSAPEVRLEE